ncbi:MAG: hypothetical protein ACREPX_11430 [Rhodanobacteraceae bacterium]
MFGNSLHSKVLDPLRRLHLPEGTDEVIASLREAKDAGQDYLTALAANVRDQGSRAGRSVGEMVRDRPAESLVLVAGAAFAVGWFVRHLRERAAVVRASRAARTTRARTRK